MSNVAHLIRRQSSRELIRTSNAERLELRELQHRLLPVAGDVVSPAVPLYGTSNAAYVDEQSTAVTNQPVSGTLRWSSHFGTNQLNQLPRLTNY